MDLHTKIHTALAIFKQGRPLILTDAEDRENEGDLIFPAELITAPIMNFIIRHSSGIVCLPLASDYIARLQLPMMVTTKDNTSRYGTPFTVSIEATRGVTTGVSAQDRVTTILTAIAPHAKPSDLARPGHVFPLHAHSQGVLGRVGHTEGAVDLMRLGGYKPAAVLCEVMNVDGTMAKGKQLQQFAHSYQLPILTIAELVQYRKQNI